LDFGLKPGGSLESKIQNLKSKMKGANVPDWRVEIRRRLAKLKLEPTREAAIIEELAQHLADCYAELLGSGATEAEAYRRTLAELSGNELLARELRRVERQVAPEPIVLGTNRRTNMIADLWQDLRYGVRMLMKQPGFTAVAVLTLALGIGANTAIFSVVNALLLRPLPFADAEQLVMIWGKAPAAGIKRLFVSVPEFLDYRERTHAFAQVGVYGGTDFTLTGQGEAERLNGAFVSTNLLALLGVKPVLGRYFLLEEEQPDRARVVLLSHGLWQRRFGGDPQLIGQALTLNGQNCTVVGIMPPGFQFPSDETEIWRPLAITAENRGEGERGSRWLSAVARLKPGVTQQQGQADLETLASNLRREYPNYYGGNSGWGINLFSLRAELAGEVGTALPILLAVVGCVLLIACANVANLLLARATARQKEIAVRAALGAHRWRIIRQLLSESLLLALAGGALGVLLALWSNEQLIKLGPRELSGGGPVGVDLRVLLFTLLVSLLTAVLFGLAPAWQATRLNLNEALKEGGRNASAGRGRLRNLLVVGEIAVALVLLLGAGLVLKSFYRLLQVDPGFDPANVLTLRLALSPEQYPEGRQQRAFYEQVLSRIEALPGVQAAGAVHNLPMSGSGNTRNFAIEGLPEPQLNVDFYQASPHYFSAMGMRLVNGRFFTHDDREEQPRVAIINETLQRRFFPNQDPLGKRIKLGNPTGPFPWLSIAGVVRDVKQNELDEETKPALYVHYLQPPLPNWRFQSLYLTVRTQSDPLNLLAAVRGAVQALDKDQPIYRVATLEQLLRRSLAARKFSMLLLALFAALALALAVIGLYSVLAYAVTQRTREIGIRLALGAQASDVLKLVVQQGMALTLMGVALGLVASFGLTRLLKTLLFGVSATDPVTYVAIVLLLAGVALLACFVPARRATRVDPLVALRSE
jgi:putative ABC transport system permease protein